MADKKRKKKKDGKLRHRWRVVKFTALQKVLLPLLMPLIWLYVRSWRISFGPEETTRPMLTEGQAGAVAVLHGHMLSLVGLVSRRWYGKKARITVITSPSRDGQLQAALLHWFGQKTVVGSSKRGGVAGLLGLRSAIRDERFGVIAVDGPRGPFGVAKPGAITLAESGRLPLWVLVTRAKPAFFLGSWDRQMVPPPFARIECRVARVDLNPAEPADAQLAMLQAAIIAEMKLIGYTGDELPHVDSHEELR